MFLGASGQGLGAPGAGFWLPVLDGNTVGGVLVFTLLAYAGVPVREYLDRLDIHRGELAE